MNWYKRLRGLILLLASMVLALIVLGWAFRDHNQYGYWRIGPEPTTLHWDPELAADGYEYWGAENWISSDYFFDRMPSTDLSDWDAVEEVRSPAWVIDAIAKGYTSASRSELGWPLGFARAELAIEPPNTEMFTTETTPYFERGGDIIAKQSGYVMVGPVPIANHPLFPGFLLLVAALYGLLVPVENALWIPYRMRIRRRRRRGWCERCGYDLSGLDGATCPECAASFTRANSSSENAR